MEHTDSIQVTWSAYNASQIRDHQFDISIISLMPLLRDHAHELATVKHAMDKAQETTLYLNPLQTPVVTADQPIYALAKQIQWAWPEHYGNFFIMLGGLHIEMTALKMLGSILKGSGWTTLLEDANIASGGTAYSFLSASNVAKTRRV
jgi:hypothetical protein